MQTSTNYVPTIYVYVVSKPVLDKEKLRKFLLAQIDKMEFPRPDLCSVTGKE